MAESGEERTWHITWEGIWVELNKASRIAGPMVAVSMFQYLLQVVSVVIIGHLGKLQLSSAAIAISLTNVTGSSLLSGLAGGLETLCGQAYGAQQYQKLGVYTHSAIISLTLVCPPICLIWFFFDKLLPLIGQEPTISLHARNFSLCLIPALFGGAILKALTRYLQTQRLTLPLLLSSFSVLCFHIPVCWVLVYRSELGYLGAAVSFSLCSWLNVAMLGFYIKISTDCEKTWARLSMEALRGVGIFFRLGVPAAVMVCLKWWAMEVLTLLSGLLPNPTLETSVLSICLTISTIHFTIPYGFGVGASVRVSTELGAGNPQSARLAVWATMLLAITEAAVIGTILFFCRSIVGYAYSSDKQVVDLVSVMVPLVCISVITDSLQGVLSGVARGSGWQHVGAYVNLGAFYLVGLPIAAVLGFKTSLKAKGLWIGIVAGSVLQTAFLALITALTNWQKQATKAKTRTGG